MALFLTKKDKVSQVVVDLTLFKDEAALRDFFAANLASLLGMQFLGKEYPTKDGRIDTLAIDETGSPVIIEYKWDAKDNILSQGLFYYDWLRENKRLFELFVADRLEKKTKVNWDRPRIVLVAQGFDRYTLAAVRQVQHVELIKYTPYSTGILYLETVYSPDTVRPREQVKPIDTGIIYGVEYHLHKANLEIRAVFEFLEKEIKAWSNVEEIAEQKVGITYRTTKSFTRFEFGVSYIDILLQKSRFGHFIDPKDLVKDISSYEWGYPGRAKIKTMQQAQAVLDLIRQAYEATL